MLHNRVRPRDTDGVIYHYCSANTLVSIIQNKTVRFSDLNMMNDAQEGLWGYRVFEEAATRLITRQGIPDEIPIIPKEFFDHVDSFWSPYGLRLANFVACFSSDGDSLSQWRAYADDGQGFAIGFKAGALRRMPVQMLDVLYDHDEQIREMTVALGATFLEFSDKGRDYTQPWFSSRCTQLAASAISLKNPAWRDEKEVRCQHVVDINISPAGWTLSDAGGVSDGQDVPGQPIHFQVRNGSIVAYLDMPFDVSEDGHPIAEVVFGPKCSNSYGNVQFLLGNNGYGIVPMRTAGAAYR